MEYNEGNIPAEEGLDVQALMHYLKKIVQKWWVILICAVLCAAVGLAAAKITYVPMYTCTISFVVDNKREDTVTGGQSASDISAGIDLARSYQIIMTETNQLMKLVAEDSGYNITGDEVKRMISSSLVEETPIIELSITSSDPEVSYAVAVSYLNNYSTITDETYKSTRAIVFDPPVMPSNPNTDRTAVLYPIAGFLLGAFAAAAFICLKVLIKDAVKSDEDIVNKLGSKLLASIVHVESGKNKKKAAPGEKKMLITDRRTDFMFVESFKVIRTKLENIARRQNYKVFIFTSADENEGKTTAAVNTALSLAKGGKSVLLIDADLRKPAVYKALNVPAANELGLAGVVKGDKSLNDSIKYFEKDNIFLLLTSTPIPDSAEILSAEETEGIIDTVREEFDYIIIDTPPGGIVADASIIAQYADACVMVVRYDRSSIRRIRGTMEDIMSSGTEVIGCIYNDTESSTASRSLRSGKKAKRGYGYGYGYGYGHTSGRTNGKN